MSTTPERERTEPPIGDCPDCEEPIPAPSPLVMFRREGEWPRMLAECPSCDGVVTPR